MYHGGYLYGFAANKENQLAKTVLGVMIKCLFGGPKFLVKMIPVVDLVSAFLFEHVTAIINLTKEVHGEVIAVICDNRINQAFFKKFQTVPGKPWLTTDNMFLLYDYVHLLKNIRYNWITDKCSELKFYHDGVEMIAKWGVLQSIYEKEKKGVIKLSKLAEVSVYPKPVERQVTHCLKLFSDETVAALKTNTYLHFYRESFTILENSKC